MVSVHRSTTIMRRSPIGAEIAKQTLRGHGFNVIAGSFNVITGPFTVITGHFNVITGLDPVIWRRTCGERWPGRGPATT